MCSLWREGLIHCRNRAAAQVRQQLFKAWLYSNYKKVFTFYNRKTKVVFWGRKYFHWKNVSTLYFLFSSPGRSSAVDVMEGPTCSNPGRRKAKTFPLFMLLLPKKINLLCVMLQSHHYILTLKGFLPSSGDIILGDSLGLVQTNPSKSRWILKYACAGSISGWDKFRLPSLQCMKTQKLRMDLSRLHTKATSCQTQSFRNHDAGLWVEWCCVPSTLILGLFWFACFNKNWEIFSFVPIEGVTSNHTM